MRHIYSKQNRALLSELVRTDFKLRYQGSVLGYAWSLLRPLMLFVILYAVFVKVMKSGGDIDHFPAYLLLGIVLWNFFVEMTVQSLGSIVGRGDLIRKIRIPRWIIVMSSSVSAVISLFINLIVVFVFMILNHVDFQSSILWLPLILAEIYLLAVGLSLFLSAVFVKFRDVSYIWEVILQAGFYLTPILYSLSIVPAKYHTYMMLNPMAQAIQDARYATVTHRTITAHKVYDGGWHQLIPFAVIVVVVVIGVLYFRKESKYFAENI